MEKQLSERELVEKYESEFSDWFDSLSKYHDNRFSNNYKKYTAYTQVKGTDTKISDPVAPELIEKVVQKLFERNPTFYVLANGKNVPKQVQNVISGVANYLWENPEMIAVSGTMRSRLKKLGREFCILGNAGIETFYNSKTNSPDFRILPIEDVIFDPTKTLTTSSVYYVRSFVSLKYLKENKEIDKDGKKYGYFKNIDEIESILKDVVQKKDDTSENRINRSGSDLYDRKVDQIELISRYEGSQVCRFIKNIGTKKDKNILIQEFDNNILEEDPLDFVMDIEVSKEPYALGMLDPLNGIIHAKDLFINQMVDYGSKVLNPPLFADPSIATNPLSRRTLGNAWRLGGLIWANPQQAEHKQMPPLGNFGFEMLTYLQQRSESNSGVGAYLSGVPNQENDKTRGTMGGIQALIQQAISPVKDRQINIEESIIEPMINKWLKISGALMDDDEIKYVFITGQSPRWVKITKGFLTGKITLNDLIEAELIGTDERLDKNGNPIGSEAAELAAELIEQGKDPTKFLIFDVDWLIKVETGSMAEVDKEKDLQSFYNWAEWMIAHGIQIDIKKIGIEGGIRSGIKEPEQYLLKEPSETSPAQPTILPQKPQLTAVGGLNG